MKYIVMHWTGGGNKANAEDLKHYHEIIEANGTRVLGNHRPEANESTADGVYAAHTRGFNTGAIGLSMAGMAGAEHNPFKPGASPITEDQVKAFCEVVAEYAETYDIEINRENVLSHSEVQVTHGVIHAGKWDIDWLPGMKKPGNPVDVGDRLREMAQQARARNFGSAVVAETTSSDRVEALVAEFVERLRQEVA